MEGYEQVTFGGNYITDHQIKSALLRDILLSLVGFFSISVFMLAHTFSLWLTFTAMAEIAVSFPVAYFFHTVAAGQEYAGILQVAHPSPGP